MPVRVFTAEWAEAGTLIDLRSRPVRPAALWDAVCAGAPQPRGAVTVAAPAPSVAQRLVGVVDAEPLQIPTDTPAALPAVDALRGAVATARAAAARQRQRLDRHTQDLRRYGEGLKRWAELAATAQAREEQLQRHEACAWRRRRGLKRRLEHTDAVGNGVRAQRVAGSDPPGRWPQPVCTQLGLLRHAATPAPVVISKEVTACVSALETVRGWLAVPAVIVA
ncbi:MAG: hypothetical protein RI544_06390 [Haloquadratum sp.]|jgi:hypothetical protein|nr:hypothetical protein [Haloferacaceae archaeon]MDR9445760.1 hypothetical protein [Haloquadratum sp.]